MKTFEFDVHRHHHHLFWKCIFLPGDSGVRPYDFTLYIPQTSDSRNIQKLEISEFMNQGGPSNVGGRAATVVEQTRSSLAWKSSENRSALGSSELGYHFKII